MWTVTIESEGPHRWAFTLAAANLDVAHYHLALDGGEWRLTSESDRFPVAAPWIGQAKIAPFEAVKRALTKLEAIHGWGSAMKATARNIATRVTEKLFEARKGHGGAAVSYLQMRPGELRETIEAAVRLHASANVEALIEEAISTCEPENADEAATAYTRQTLRRKFLAVLEG